MSFAEQSREEQKLATIQNDTQNAITMILVNTLLGLYMFL
jgi:hypothetical protein